MAGRAPWTVALLAAGMLVAAAGCAGKPEGPVPSAATAIPPAPALAAASPTTIPAAASEPATVTSQIQGFAFVDLSVPTGTTVSWSNLDSAPHTVTSGGSRQPDGLFDSGNLAPGASFSLAFDTPGTYAFYCKYHAGMEAVVSVGDGAMAKAATPIATGAMAPSSPTPVATGMPSSLEEPEASATPETTAMATPEPIPTPEATATGTPEPTVTPEPTATPEATATATPEPTTTTETTATATPEPTATPETTATATPEPTATSTTVPPPAVESPIQGFILQDLTLKVGTTVKWVNKDSSPHTATEGTPSSMTHLWASPFLSKNQSFSFTLTQTGTFSYFCEVHNEMQATVTVVP